MDDETEMAKMADSGLNTSSNINTNLPNIIRGPALLSLPTSSSSVSKPSFPITGIIAPLQNRNAVQQHFSAYSSEVPFASGEHERAAKDVTMGGMGPNNITEVNDQLTISDDGDSDQQTTAYNRAKPEMELFEVSEDEEHVKAAMRNNRYDSGSLGKASIWWHKALKESRAETDAYAARKHKYKEALSTQCRYAERLEKENSELAQLQDVNATRIAALQKELRRAGRRHR